MKSRLCIWTSSFGNEAFAVWFANAVRFSAFRKTSVVAEGLGRIGTTPSRTGVLASFARRPTDRARRDQRLCRQYSSSIIVNFLVRRKYGDFLLNYRHHGQPSPYLGARQAGDRLCGMSPTSRSRYPRGEAPTSCHARRLLAMDERTMFEGGVFVTVTDMCYLAAHPYRSNPALTRLERASRPPA